jgi:tetratricopeptide (TPR) repeat protein
MTTENQTAPTNAQQDPELAARLSQAWRCHANQDYTQAESLFRQALAANPEAEEAAYGLGLALKLSQRSADAQQYFQTALTLLESSTSQQDSVRRVMLRRLVNAHLSMLSA